MELDFKRKKLRVLKNSSGVEFELLPFRLKVFVKLDDLYKVKTALEMQFFGTLKEKVVVQGENGYLVFFKGRDRWGLRLSDGKVREAVYLSRKDVLEMKNYLGG